MNYSRNLTENQINDNYNEFIEFIKVSFKDNEERLQKLLHMYSEDELGLRAAIAPASANLNFHLCHTGGYIQHIMNVVNASKYYGILYQKMGGTIDYTDEERIFAALHHDLGKLGDHEGRPYYLDQDDQWAQKKKNEMYKFNPDIQWMDVTDRALFLLQYYDIKMTWKETLGIKLADGIYNEASKKYYIVYNPDNSLKTSLPYVIHGGDFLSCNTERDMYKRDTKDN